VLDPSAIYVPNSSLVSKPEVPKIEWWDEFLLPEGSETFPETITCSDLFVERITHYI